MRTSLLGQLFLFLAITIGLLTPARAETEIFRLSLGRGHSVRVGVLNPANKQRVKADILFFHGFGDRFDNHGPLFEAMSRAGFRVISFDLPSHGESSTLRLDFFGFRELGELAILVETATRESISRPLFLSGWSLGGLLAARMAQTPLLKSLARRPSGMVLFAPGVSVYKLVGGDGIVRTETLTSNPQPPHRAEPMPASPLYTPVFAASLLANSYLAFSQPVPGDVPTLVFSAGLREDLYVKTARLQEWVLRQRRRGAMIWGRSCQGARHELDNEPAPVGPEVQDLTVRFLNLTLSRKPREIAAASGACASY